MGEVYRAKDDRLGRDVAIKILPERYLDNGSRVQRFEQEARAAGRLNHPNILAIYDVGATDQCRYIVSELVDGESLRVRLEQGPLPVRKAVDYALQIAHGLAAAHDHGIIHRDLKPENILITRDGWVKILDFGLAKLLPEFNEEGSFDQSTFNKTSPGAILGTVSYMSPEQAQGRPTDHRSDLFSFGCVLYEMLAGRQPFNRPSVFETVTAIIREDPDPLTRLSPKVSPALERLVLHCLEKSPAERFQSARDIAFDLNAITADSSQQVRSVFSRRVHRQWLPWAVAATALIVAAVATRRPGGDATESVPRPTLATVVLPPTAPLLEPSNFPMLAIAPDGSSFVYVGRASEGNQLHVRWMDRAEAVPIPGTVGAHTPFFSPDGKWIGFAADGKLRKVALAGGAPQTLCDAPLFRGAAWGPEGTIVFSGQPGGLSSVPAAGGPVRTVTKLNTQRNEQTHRWPAFLPDGQHVAFTVNNLSGNFDQARIEVVSLRDGKRDLVLEGGTYSQYVKPGYLLYIRGDSLFALRFDTRQMKVHGSPIPVITKVQSFRPAGFADVAASFDGRILYVPFDPTVELKELVRVSRDGTSRPIVAERRQYASPRISPDGRRLVVLIGQSGSWDVWVYEMERNAWIRLTFDGRSSGGFAWSPDGQRIAFSSGRGGLLTVFLMNADGGAEPQQVTPAQNWRFPEDWSHDGRALLILESHPTRNFDLLVQPIGKDEVTPFVATPAAEGGGKISPNDRWVAYVSNESGKSEVYVRPLRAGEQRWVVSTDGGTSPVWGPTGDELFYRSGTRVMVVAVQTDGAFQAGKPRVLFEGDFDRPFDTVDGQTFYMTRSSEEASPRHLNLLIGAFSAVER